ncbi:predicted protein, partial [Nematostella vectensis]
ITMIVLYTIVGVLAFVGNVFVLHVLRTRLSARRNVGFMFANMAVADLLTALIIIPKQITQAARNNLWFPGMLADVLCRACDFTVFTSIAASILTLTIMSLDRFVGIMLPQHKQTTLFHRASVVTPFVWITSTLLMSPIIVVSTSLPSSLYPDDPARCRQTWSVLGDVDLSQQVFYAFVLVMLYIIPLVVMTTIYSSICFKLWIHRTPGETIPAVTRRVERKNRRVIRMLVIVVVVFAACWLPPHVMHIYSAFYWREFSVNITRYNIDDIMFFIGQANSAINPILYIWLNSEFRKAFGRAFR